MSEDIDWLNSELKSFEFTCKKCYENNLDENIVKFENC